jgi:hypothetical protein
MRPEVLAMLVNGLDLDARTTAQELDGAHGSRIATSTLEPIGQRCLLDG